MNKAGIIILIGILTLSHNALSQCDSIDLELIDQADFSAVSVETYYPSPEINTKEVLKDTTGGFNPFTLILDGLFFLYQNLVSEQISASCLYEITCSNFGKYAIHELGPIKGFFIALDRVTRCSSFTVEEIPQHRHNPHTHKVKDVPSDYRLKKD